MPFIASADEWLTLSAQLLEARPTTTRITTKYNITSARARKARKSKLQSGAAVDAAADADTPMTDANANAKPPRANLILKTFCPHSGVCLKYKTAKAAEVGRLVQMLGSLGRNMSGMPALPVSAAPMVVEEELGGGGGGVATPPVGAQPSAAAATAGAGAGAGGAAAGGGGGEGGKGKKKKKGKR